MARVRSTVFSIAALVLVCLQHVQSVPANSRILGGEDADKSDFPYVASVRLDMAHYCGGSIISHNAILTAAHCVIESKTTKAVDATRLSVRVGSTNHLAGGVIAQVAEVIVHPDYTSLKNDLAILRLSSSLEWTDRITAVDFAKSADEEPSVGDDVTVAGWGERANGVAPYKLQTTSFTIADDESCSDAYSDGDDSVVCLAHEPQHGSCYGDAGNGAVHNSVLVAVSSFIVGACGARYPDVYANVAYFADWIQEHIE